LITDESGEFEIAITMKETQNTLRQFIRILLYDTKFLNKIDSKLRPVMEKGVEENVLEMALRGHPKENFNMVGRMNGQSAVLEAEKSKGTMTLTVDERYMENCQRK